MIEKIIFGVSETTDTNQSQKDIFNPDIESISISEKSVEVISIPVDALDMLIDFGSTITNPALIVLCADRDLNLTLTNGTDTISLLMKADETYRLPRGITGVHITNGAGEIATLTKIIGF
jgi:hypothetical protein